MPTYVRVERGRRNRSSAASCVKKRSPTGSPGITLRANRPAAGDKCPRARGLARRLRAIVFRILAQHGPQLFEKIVGVVELPVDAREAHESDRIQIAKVSHDDLAELAAFDFAVEMLIDVVFNGERGRFNLPRCYWALPAGPFEAALDFLPLERHARAIFLDDFDRSFFRALVRRKAPAAAHALTPPANR